MALNSLKDVYIDQLQDMHSADRQSLDATKKMLEVAKNKELRTALENGVKGIASGIETLEAILEGHDADPKGEFCKGMEGLVKEVHAHVLKADFGDDDARDAMIISQYQRMTHYGIAGYGCVAAFARRLELNDNAGRLQECLDSTYEGDREMSRIAEGTVNADAV